MCIFKALHINPNEQYTELSLEAFYHFYEVKDLRWRQVKEMIHRGSVWLGGGGGQANIESDTIELASQSLIHTGCSSCN